MGFLFWCMFLPTRTRAPFFFRLYTNIPQSEGANPPQKWAQPPPPCFAAPPLLQPPQHERPCVSAATTPPLLLPGAGKGGIAPDNAVDVPVKQPPSVAPPDFDFLGGFRLFWGNKKVYDRFKKPVFFETGMLTTPTQMNVILQLNSASEFQLQFHLTGSSQ